MNNTFNMIIVNIIVNKYQVQLQVVAHTHAVAFLKLALPAEN